MIVDIEGGFGSGSSSKIRNLLEMVESKNYKIIGKQFPTRVYVDQNNSPKITLTASIPKRYSLRLTRVEHIFEEKDFPQNSPLLSTATHAEACGN